MIYTLKNTILAGKPVKHVFDANGLEWTKVIECDTDTGEIYRYQTDENCSVFSDGEGGLATERIKTAAPLRVVFRESQADRGRISE